MQGRIQDFKLGGVHLKFVGVFRVKNHDFMPKNHIFSNFRGWGGGGGGGAPPGSTPAYVLSLSETICKFLVFLDTLASFNI
jgi:hypothetical protein